MLFIVLLKLRWWYRRNTRVEGHTTSGQIATEVHHNVTSDDDEDDTMGSQISGEVSINVAVDDDNDANNGESAMSQTSLAVM